MINLSAFKPNNSNIRYLFGNNNALNKSKQQPNRYANLSPLSKDTFCFTGSTALNRSLMEAFDNTEVCKSVYENAKTAADDLKDILETSLSEFISTKNNPSLPIDHILIRVKTPESIREKAADRLGSAILNGLGAFNPNKQRDIKIQVGDLIGARIVLRDPEDENASKIIARLIEQIEKGNLKITRIESYQPDVNSDSMAYFKKKDIDMLEKAINDNSQNKVERLVSSKETGYIALHLDLDLSNPDKYVSNKDGFRGEIQIVGTDVSNLKEVEDLCYKLKSKKNVKRNNVAYKPFKRYFLHYLGDSDEMKNNFDEYTSRAYAIQRKKEPKPHKLNKKTALPTIAECKMTGKLPEELDFNRLKLIKTHCDELYKFTETINQ